MLKRLPALAVALGFLVLLFAVVIGASAEPAPVLPGSTVKVVVPEGHGSGVYIGDGYVLTAAHVVNGSFASVKVLADDGTEQPAEVVVFDKIEDIAVLKISGAEMAAAPLACRVAALGEEVQAAGNPAELDFIHTYGHVVGSLRPLGPWPKAIVIDAAVLGGMSGGPLFDAHGDVVGIVVGIYANGGLFGPPSPTGFAFAVPATVACRLLDRA